MSDMTTPTFSSRLDELERAVREWTDRVPRLGIVLGSGLGGLADELEDVVAIGFDELPGWPPATAPGHSGQLLFGTLEGVPVVCLKGRLHLYEGNSERLVVEPVLLMGRLGLRPQLRRHRVPVEAVQRRVEVRVADDPPRGVERLDAQGRLRTWPRDGRRGQDQCQRQGRKHPSTPAAGGRTHFSRAFMPCGRSKTEGGTRSYSIELIVIT